MGVKTLIFYLVLAAILIISLVIFIIDPMDKYVHGFKMTPELEKEKTLLNKCITADFHDSPKCDKVYGGNVTHGNNEVPFP